MKLSIAPSTFLDLSCTVYIPNGGLILESYENRAYILWARRTVFACYNMWRVFTLEHEKSDCFACFLRSCLCYNRWDMTKKWILVVCTTKVESFSYAMNI